jgi:hypothetical protein
MQDPAEQRRILCGRAAWLPEGSGLSSDRAASLPETAKLVAIRGQA